MKFDPQKHNRRSIRLKNYDYASEGAYYVTVVTQGRECLFGEIVDAKMYLSNYGEIVQKWWDNIPHHFPNVETGAFVIMPNHIHGIVFVTEERRGEVVSPHDQPNDSNQKNTMQTRETDNQGGEIPPLRRPTLGQIVAYFKYQSTKEMNEADNTGIITKFWQRNYYEHIIRNEKELRRKTDYILDNPSQWDEDQENPRNIKSPNL
jgi:REP element-mobilizing transposase RayT